MTINTEDIERLIYSCVDEINNNLPIDRQLSKTPQAILLGEGGVLDSLSLITLLVSVEEALKMHKGVSCFVLDEEQMTNPDGHYHTIRRLSEWIVAKLGNSSSNGV